MSSKPLNAKVPNVLLVLAHKPPSEYISYFFKFDSSDLTFARRLFTLRYYLQDCPDFLCPGVPSFPALFSAADFSLPLPVFDSSRPLSEYSFSLPCPVCPWSPSVSRSLVGCFHFYVWDVKFSGIVRSPSLLLESSTPCFFEPNFSLSDSADFPEVLSVVALKRRISRILLDDRRLLFVDLNVSPRFLLLSLLGVPVGYPFYSSRSHRGLSSLDLLLQYYLALINYSLGFSSEASCDAFAPYPFVFCVFGGGEPVSDLFSDLPGFVQVSAPGKWSRSSRFLVSDSQNSFFPLSLSQINDALSVLRSRDSFLDARRSLCG